MRVCVCVYLHTFNEFVEALGAAASGRVIVYTCTCTCTYTFIYLSIYIYIYIYIQRERERERERENIKCKLCDKQVHAYI